MNSHINLAINHCQDNRRLNNIKFNSVRGQVKLAKMTARNRSRTPPPVNALMDLFRSLSLRSTITESTASTAEPSASETKPSDMDTGSDSRGPEISYWDNRWWTKHKGVKIVLRPRRIRPIFIPFNS